MYQKHHFVFLFVENAVTVEMFKDLSQDLIKELIPKIGNRIVFNKKLAIWNAGVIIETNDAVQQVRYLVKLTDIIRKLLMKAS